MALYHAKSANENELRRIYTSGAGLVHLTARVLVKDPPKSENIATGSRVVVPAPPHPPLEINDEILVNSKSRPDAASRSARPPSSPVARAENDAEEPPLVIRIRCAQTKIYYDGTAVLAKEAFEGAVTATALFSVPRPGPLKCYQYHIDIASLPKQALHIDNLAEDAAWVISRSSRLASLFLMILAISSYVYVIGPIIPSSRDVWYVPHWIAGTYALGAFLITVLAPALTILPQGRNAAIEALRDLGVGDVLARTTIFVLVAVIGAAALSSWYSGHFYELTNRTKFESLETGASGEQSTFKSRFFGSLDPEVSLAFRELAGACSRNGTTPGPEERISRLKSFIPRRKRDEKEPGDVCIVAQTQDWVNPTFGLKNTNDRIACCVPNATTLAEIRRPARTWPQANPTIFVALDEAPQKATEPAPPVEVAKETTPIDGLDPSVAVPLPPPEKLVTLHNWTGARLVCQDVTIKNTKNAACIETALESKISLSVNLCKSTKADSKVVDADPTAVAFLRGLSRDICIAKATERDGKSEFHGIMRAGEQVKCCKPVLPPNGKLAPPSDLIAGLPSTRKVVYCIYTPSTGECEQYHPTGGLQGTPPGEPVDVKKCSPHLHCDGAWSKSK